MNELPAKRELGEPPQVAVAIPDPMITEEEGLQAMKRQGMTVIGSALFTDLRAIGICVQQVGITKIQRGRAVMTQERLDNTIRLLNEQLTAIAMDDKLKSKDKAMAIARLSEALAQCTTKMHESIGLMVRLDTGRQLSEEAVIPSPESTVKTFGANDVVRPGNTMIAAREVHIHEAQKSPSP